MTIADPRSRRFTREEFYQMADLGFFQDQRVELINGEIIEMAPQNETHAAIISLVQREVERVFGSASWVRVQMPVIGGPASDPEPDLAVVEGNPRDFLGKQHPATALLVVEVSETTLRFDRGLKSNLYAAMGIEDYWIVNLIDNRLEVCRAPRADASAPFGHRYETVTVLKRGEFVHPLARPDSQIAVADLLP